MNPPVGVVTHLHGAVVQGAQMSGGTITDPGSDGWPLFPVGFLGNPYNFPSSQQYTYPNDQRAVMLWFHDHAMDNTSIQVHAGLAGLYFIRDESDDDIFNMIGSQKESEKAHGILAWHSGQAMKRQADKFFGSM